VSRAVRVRAIGPVSVRSLFLLAAAPLLMGAECEEPLLKDSGFDVWCGDTLCAWQVDEGRIAKVPTWHGSDYGVELEGASVRISQLLAFGNDDVVCLHFNLLAAVDEPVNVVLDLDFDNDGSTEHSESIPNGAWIPLKYRITAPTYYRTLRISIRKSGEGHAALAQIQAAKSSDCTGPALSTRNRPAGATCAAASECGTGRCLVRTPAERLLPDANPPGMVCEACEYDGDSTCAPGLVCGLGFGDRFVEPFRSCRPGATSVLGDRCLTAAECGTGVCCNGICSTCCTDGTDGTAGCTASDECRERVRDPDQGPLRAAWQCSPGDRRGATSTPCLGAEDCAGGSCAGATLLTVCASDGRRCGSDSDCPITFFDNSCIAVGVAGGRCQ
jgi:hypothetical protein